jgi:hypothetical protein
MFDEGYPEVVPRAVEEFRTRLSAEPGRPAGRRSACTSAAAASGATCPSGRHRMPAPGPGTSAQTARSANSRRRRLGHRRSATTRPIRPPPLAGRSCLAPRAAWTTPAWKHAPTSSRSPPRRSPAALEILGPVSVRLRPRSGNPHHDVFARLCDVDPGGTSRNICDGLIRHQVAERCRRDNHDEQRPVGRAN